MTVPHDCSPPQSADEGAVSTARVNPAEVLTPYLALSSSDQASWWQETGFLFNRFLEAGQYDLHRQYQFLSFFVHHLVPFLGPYPHKWRSTISRSGLPIEFSLNFQKGSHRLVRIGFEPVSFLSGTAKDPFNQVTVADLLCRLERIQLEGFDTRFFRQLISTFQLSLGDVQRLSQQEGGADAPLLKSQAAFGFDFKPDGNILVKGYVFPYLKAKTTGVQVASLIENTVRSMDVEMKPFLPAFSLIHDYMQESTGYNEYTFLSCDCVDLPQQRLKIYGAHTEVTWAKIAEIWTLGGRLIEEKEIINGLRLLKQIWSLLHIGEGSRAFKGAFDDGKATADDQVPSPIIWNYEVHPYSTYPVPKFYIPVHGENDLHNARSLAQFWNTLDCPEYAGRYEEILQRL